MRSREHSDEKGEWCQHPHSDRLRRKAEQLQKQALDALLGACKDSSDPAIVKKFSSYSQYEKMLRVLRGEELA